MSKLEVLVTAGDGIGPEVTREAVRVLDVMAKRQGSRCTSSTSPFGGASVDQHGVPATDALLKRATEVDAVLLGAVGGPGSTALPADKRPREGVAQPAHGDGSLREPAACQDLPGTRGRLAAAQRPSRSAVDYVVVRELIGGLYFGKPGSLSGEPGQQVGINTLTYTEDEIKRIGRKAFEIARQRPKKVCSIDKANVLETMVLWRRTMEALSKEYPDVALSHMYVDNCAMQLVLNPGQFDVLVCENLFGDILSDEAGATTGSIGLLPSASLGESVLSTSRSTALPRTSRARTRPTRWPPSFRWRCCSSTRSRIALSQRRSSAP